ncbi:MAG: hypothetical protein PHD74_08655, partial [Candidatus Krumholzibacteria bacterium]|nr:hypothetical protein [Candidatus Krumholzibacteria bacterium]
ETLIERLGLVQSVVMAKAADGKGRLFQWFIGSALLADGGVLEKSVCDAFDVDWPVFYFDLCIDALPPAGGAWPKYSQITPYPAVKRDLCIVVDENVQFDELRNIITKQAQYLDSIRLFDYYEGRPLGEGKRSYTFRLSFRSPEGTLDSITVDKDVQRVLGALQRELGAVLRSE